MFQHINITIFRARYLAGCGGSATAAPRLADDYKGEKGAWVGCCERELFSGD
jgi:hypothetical protein